MGAPEDVPLGRAGARAVAERILVVEDEPDLLEVVQDLLTELGYEILTAKEPAEALEICETDGGRIHLLLTDLTLPGMNGRELARLVTAVRPGIRVLFVSGQRGTLEPGEDFLMKPASIDALSGKVRDVLDRP